MHVITSLDVGGAQKHLLSLMKGLRLRGHTADVAFFKNPSLAQEFRSAGIRLYDLHAEGGLSPLLVPRLAHILFHGRYQIVHTHLLKADVYGALASILARTPVRVASKHNDEAVLRRPTVAAVHGLISRLDHRVVVLSDHVGAYMASTGCIDPARITRIYYGLSPQPVGVEQRERVRLELGIPPDAPLVATVGRLTEQKGLTYLLQAWSAVQRRMTDARLLVVGDSQDGRDEYKRGLLKLRDDLGLGESVLFTGVRADVPAVMQAIDLFAMPSLWEGFGMVFLEAMAAARPIVATRVSAIPEVVDEGVTGILVAPRDSRSLAEAILALLADRERALSMGIAGLLRLEERFTEDAMVEAVESLYLQLWRSH